MVPRTLLVVVTDPALAGQVRGVLDSRLKPGDGAHAPRVLAADGLDGAAEMLTAQRPPLILLPVSPPDGPELAGVTRFLAESPATKIIALVPADHRVLAVRAVARGVHEVCRVPIDGEELILVVERAFQRADLELESRRLETGDAPPTLRLLREVAERRALLDALARTGGNLSATARALGVSRPTLYSLLRQHGVRTD